MILRPDRNIGSGRGVSLEVTFQAEVVVSGHEQLIIHTAVRIMTSGAPFADGFMLENKRAPLGGVALNTSVAFGHH